MKKIFWTEAQMTELEEVQKTYSVPQEVILNIQNTLKILDRYYGAERNVYHEDGGFVLLVIPESEGEVKKEYTDLMEKYNLNEDEAEFQDLLCSDEITVWHSDLFIVSNDYGITIVYNEKRGD